MLKKLSALGLASLLSLGGMSAATAADLLDVDLTVANQITITGLPGVSFVSASGNTGTGFYLANFFSGTAVLIGTNVLPGGNLTAASVPTDTTPFLFRSTAGADPGLNVYTYSATLTTTFTAGQQAFNGSATWTVSPAVFAAALAGAGPRNVYFPADHVGALATAQLLGTYTVTPIPEPATVVLMGLGALALLAVRRRQSRD